MSGLIFGIFLVNEQVNAYKYAGMAVISLTLAIYIIYQHWVVTRYVQRSDSKDDDIEKIIEDLDPLPNIDIEPGDSLLTRCWKCFGNVAAFVLSDENNTTMINTARRMTESFQTDLTPGDLEESYVTSEFFDFPEESSHTKDDTTFVFADDDSFLSGNEELEDFEFLGDRISNTKQLEEI